MNDVDKILDAAWIDDETGWWCVWHCGRKLVTIDWYRLRSLVELSCGVRAGEGE